jgi:hypothetical protein
MANNQLIDDVISAVIFNKAAHEQSTWATARSNSSHTKPTMAAFKGECGGGKACIAGWTCILLGQKFTWGMPTWVEDYVEWTAQFVGDHDDIQTVAQEALGLSYEEADLIFHTMDEDAAIELLKRVKNGECIYEPEPEVYDETEPEFDYDVD